MYARTCRIGAAGRSYLTRSEVARMLGVSPNTVTRWAREGRLASQLTLGGHHRFERAIVEELQRRLNREGRADVGAPDLGGAR